MGKASDNSYLFEYDSAARSGGGAALLCGVDEAGRGPLAGGVYAAAVILPDGLNIGGLNDSKKLSEKRREELYDVITEKAVAYSVAYATEREIDEINILRATMLAMRRAVDGLSIVPQLVLVDGNTLPPLKEDIRAVCIVKGDATSASIAAASVLAKVERDRVMRRLAQEYPQYGFDRHKGYGTKEHYAAIEEYGVLDIHRKTFLKGIV